MPALIWLKLVDDIKTSYAFQKWAKGSFGNGISLFLRWNKNLNMSCLILCEEGVDIKKIVGIYVMTHVN